MALNSNQSCYCILICPYWPIQQIRINHLVKTTRRQIGTEISGKKAYTPVMILSGNNDEEVILKGFELGVSDYMKTVELE
jgi:PleD family two-component response regulator